MKKWKTVSEIDLVGKKVLIRGDLDVDDGDNPRVQSVIDIVNYVQNKKAARTKVVGHRETDYQVCDDLRARFPEVEFDDTIRNNLGEKANNYEYAQEIASGWEVYINEAFATSHRVHASIVSVPEIIKERGGEVTVGLRFEKELERLNEVWSKQGKKILVIGGVKIDDKQKFAEGMKDRFSAVLKGGKLPGVITRPDGLDLADEVIKEYEKAIGEVDMILAAGVMGKYEDPNASEGTRRVLEAIANNSHAYKVAGGGDIEMAISRYGLTEKFDWISVGGGAMLVYLASGALPGLDAVSLM